MALSHSLGSLQKKVIDISYHAGKEIIKIYTDYSDFEIESKSDNSPLTIADKKSNEIICQELKRINQDIPILSEEEKEVDYSTRKDWNTFWLVDPLDGTKEFIKRNGEFTTNIALIENGSPAMGVVYAPCLDTIWAGNKETGSIKVESGKSEKIEASAYSKGTIRVATSRSHGNTKIQAILDEYDSYELKTMGSSIKICLVGDGRVHIYPRLGPTMEWDTAAAHAVVKFAGANILDYHTRAELLYNKESLLNNEFIVTK